MIFIIAVRFEQSENSELSRIAIACMGMHSSCSSIGFLLGFSFEGKFVV